MERVRIIQNNENEFVKCFVGGNEVKNVIGAEFHFSKGSVPNLKFNIYGGIDIDLLCKTEIEFTPKTIKDAMLVLQKELSNECSDIRKAFEASVRSAILDCNDEILISDLAKKITDRIAGCEEDK